jgi:hypothetical protein
MARIRVDAEDARSAQSGTGLSLVLVVSTALAAIGLAMTAFFIMN